MPVPALPHDLTNGQPNDADEVMANLEAIINAFTDMDESNLAVALLNTFLRLAVPGAFEAKWWSGTTANFDHDSAGGPYHGELTIAHGMGVAPVWAKAGARGGMGIQVPAAAGWLDNTSAHTEVHVPNVGVRSSDATNIVVGANVWGYVTNNPADVWCIAIFPA